MEYARDLGQSLLSHYPDNLEPDECPDCAALESMCEECKYDVWCDEVYLKEKGLG